MVPHPRCQSHADRGGAARAEKYGGDEFTGAGHFGFSGHFCHSADGDKGGLVPEICADPDDDSEFYQLDSRLCAGLFTVFRG
ncbi:hypothetical protein D3C85_1689550 [compost metagenome]